MPSIIEDALKKTSPEICQHALIGTINKTEAEEAPFAENASELSQHGHDEDEDRAYGRMRAVKESATAPAEKDLWEHALSQVCKDECDDLLKMMKKEKFHLAKDVLGHHTPFAQTCAKRVVRKSWAVVGALAVLTAAGACCGLFFRQRRKWIGSSNAVLRSAS